MVRCAVGVILALRQARRDRQLVSKRLLLNEDEEQPEETMDTTSREQDVVSLFHKLQHGGVEKEAHLKVLSKSLRDPAAQLTFIKQENSMHLLVGLLTGSNAQCRLLAVRCLHELSHSPHSSVASACLPATPYLLTYLSGQSTKFTELCLYTLGNICPDSEGVREKVLAQGIVPALANCIENQRHNLAVVEAVGFTLSQLLQTKAAAEKIVPSQVGDIHLVVALCALIQAYLHTQPALARETAWVLNNLTEFCSALLSLNLLPGLIQLLPFSQGINTMGLRILANIAHKKKEFCVLLAQSGLLSALSDTLKMADQEMVTLSLDVLFMMVVSSPQIVMLMSGCAELMMGFILAGVSEWTSYKIYIPFWQGALVTVCLAMYVVTLLGVLVSFGYRGYCFGWLSYRYHGSSRFHIGQTLGVEIVLLFFSICVSAILIFLIVVARFALKSTRTQVIVHHIPLPRNGTPAD
ncbi:unnamed protein product [Menidia menidia]|uniref:(Atlantic silverside) hypothetical protein n=1 Tax=Menidia menidia TaxID=238744 RepID=A0A8S4BTS0_9TELE|nr:unnamed protein product [Menidia menidia]